MRFLRSAAVLALLAAPTLAGCSTTHHSKVGDNVDVDQYAKVEAALEIGQACEANVKVTELFGFLKFGLPSEFADGVAYGKGGGGGGLFAGLFGPGTAEAAKAGAAYQAMKSGDYDVLLGARYHLRIDDFLIFKKYDVTVRGTGAKVTGYTQTH